MSVTEKRLLKKARSGDKSAFRKIVDTYQQQVRTTVLGMLGNAVEADDVAQEVFIRFYKSLHQFKGEAKLSTYLTRIAINLSLNELKRQQRHQSRNLALDSAQVLQIEDGASNPIHDENRALVQQALQLLDVDFRTVVVLRLIEGYSVKETAELLKVPSGTVASRLARAQLKLKTIFEQLGVNEL